MRVIILASAVLFSLLPALTLRAQEPAALPKESAAEAPDPKTPGSKAALIDGFMPGRQEASVKAPGQPAFSLDSPDSQTVEPATRSREQAAWRAYYDYRIRGLQHRSNTYSWQLVSSKIIFVVVILLVFVGLYFSWLQFRLSLQPRPTAVSAMTAGTKPEEAPGTALTQSAVVMAVTEISAGRDGIKVSSPVLGVIILVVSLLFFYLYLVYIYPISELF